MYEHLQKSLEKKKQENALRRLSTHNHLIDFSSNDYLGLAQSLSLRNTIEEKYNNYRGRLNGSTGSRLLSGNDNFVQNTETQLADFFQSEAALIFNSGYSANLSLFSSIPQKGDTIIYDERIHASVKDGARLSLANRFSFKHNNPDDLIKKINAASGKVYVAIESVYSMDGDISPVVEIQKICESSGAFLIVDEAHSTGIWGSDGSGMCCMHNLQDKVFARVHTFGKAMGVHGACVAGGKVLIDYLINFARPFIYTTALSPHSVASISASCSMMKHIQHEREKLFHNIQVYRTQICNTGISQFASLHHTPIQIIQLEGNTRVKEVSKFLNESGYNVRPILSPTVPKNSERLRICIHSFNTIEQIENLVKALAEKIFHI
ncbi:MAG: 8-amino-7-oxononanoate synthase [Cytophagaceae bacterium]|nr:8-amino-7-oxononanoate synthase [Cytophagaceae bacterium]MDW8455489.1 8-amino-7-oxononanoate synthase [Cytophagaceae bacterium]